MDERRLFERESLYQTLECMGQHAWSQQLRTLCAQRMTPELHGNMPGWIEAWKKLPPPQAVHWDATQPAVTVNSSNTLDVDDFRQSLHTFHPWRKGPFELFGIEIDTEWRSNLKWDRIASSIDFAGKQVLDVGCGNGYYGWRMLAAGAQLVVGCDPFPLYLMQFEVLRRYAPWPERHFVLPLTDEDLPDNLAVFDITLSMGVLYHRPQPLAHLSKLYQTLAPGGQLVLETLIIESSQEKALSPPGRYAKMKNIGLIPSLPLLARWLQEAGFSEVQTIDVTRTTAHEQRRTEWMTFESLDDFLDPHDLNWTIEGHPAPIRAVIIARRS